MYTAHQWNAAEHATYKSPLPLSNTWHFLSLSLADELLH